METRTLPAVSTRNVAPGTPSCIVIGEGRAVAIDRSVRIGRDASCELALDDAAISRFHATLTAESEERWVVRDCGSRNGTFVDARRIESAEVGMGAVIRVGESVIRLARLDGPYAAAHDRALLVGGSSLAPVRRALGLVGPTPLAVLLHGETGTGKDVLARALHEASGRRGPFVAVNCAALPDALVESELFGHARGAFTGAGTARKGLIAEAEGGTLFLDEVGEIPIGVQAKLLRVLEDHKVRPVGAEREYQVDVRFVSATHQDLETRIAAGQFRQDLHARLAGLVLRLPPLRDRVEDLPALIRHLQRRAPGATERMPTADALEAMTLHRWPNNIRELDHALHAAALAGAPRIELDALPAGVCARFLASRAGERTSSPTLTRGRPLPFVDRRDDVEAAMRAHAGNLRRAAQSLGIARGHLYRLIERWNLDPAAYRPSAGTPSAQGA